MDITPPILKDLEKLEDDMYLYIYQVKKSGYAPNRYKPSIKEYRIPTKDLIGGGSALSLKEIEDYRSSLESSGYIYSGYLENSIPVVTRCLNSVETTAERVTNLETDWENRETLIYK
jgi:hypothetical protein